MSRTLYKYTTLAAEAVTDQGTFEGYASNFGVLDQGNDIVVRGAYAATLAKRGPRGIKLLYQHDSSQPLGWWEAMSEDEIGLKVRGRLMVDEVPKAREVHALMKAGVIDGLSIGYCVVNAARDASNGARLLQEVDLREISVVTFPMNEESRIATVKGFPSEREFERMLTQDAGFTRSQARQIIAGGYKALAAKPGAGDGDSGSQWGGLARSLRDLNTILA